jgi:hypothetical protein
MTKRADIAHPLTHETAAVLGNAMTDYLLAVRAKTAPAARTPDHMANWLDAHGYRIVRVPTDIETGDPAEAMYARWRDVCPPVEPGR